MLGALALSGLVCVMTVPAAAGAMAPRCVQDLIEERLFARRRDLFSDLSLVFLDTTSLAFCDAVGLHLQPTGLSRGGESRGAHGHSNDHRPDLKQMILAMINRWRGAADLHRDAGGQHR